MKKIIVFCLVLLLNNAFSKNNFSLFLNHNPPPPPIVKTRNSHVFMKYFTQKLDHFNSEDNTTWSQVQGTTLSPTQFLNKSTNNTAFLMLGGEGYASENWMMSGSWVVSARKYGALIFQLEHRFYGFSIPFNDLGTKNLRYLSSKQALADAANFIQSMNEIHSLGSDVKWIVFGGSYSGSLAAWMRLKYPELVHGAVSSSAPLLAKLDFPEYFTVVINDLAITNEECVSSLQVATDHVDELLLNITSFEETVTSIFNLCEPIEKLDSKDRSIGLFYRRLADPFAQAAENNRLDNRFALFGIKELCYLMTDTRNKEIYRLANVIKFFGTDGCMDYSYQGLVEYLRDITPVGAHRQWTYQLCTEFGLFQTTNRKDRVFGRGNPINMYISLCEDVFGPEFNTTFINSQIDRTNADYGGTNISVSNVVYVYGSFDPWHAVGILASTNPESPVIFIEGTSHCADMYQATAGELPQLTAARKEVDRIIGEWLRFKPVYHKQ